MPLDLVNMDVQLGENTVKLLQIIPEIENDLLSFGKDGTNQATKLALSAFKSSVPVFSKQLRNQHIQADFAKSNQKVMKSRVYVVDQEHSATPRGKELISSELAKILDQGVHEHSGKSMKRSQASIPESSFPSLTGSTEGWIDDAYINFLLRADKEVFY